MHHALTTSRLWPTILLVVLGLSWGGHFSLLKIASESGLSHIGIIALTTAGVVMGMSGVSAVRRRWPVLRADTLRFYLICAVLGYLIEFPLGLYVADHIPAGLLVIIGSTSPVFTSLIAVIGKVEPVSRQKLGAVGVGLVAAGIVIIPGTALPQPALLGWVLIAFGIPITYASYHNYIVYAWPEGLDSWQVALGESAVAGVLTMGLFALSDAPLAEFADWRNGSWTIAVMAILALIEIYLYFEIVRLAGAVFVSLAGLVSIIAGIVWGMVLFGEQHNNWIWVSVVLLCLSLLLARERQSD